MEIEDGTEVIESNSIFENEDTTGEVENVNISTQRREMDNENDTVFLWNTLDDSIKNEPTLQAFKHKIKMWSGKECICRSIYIFVFFVYDILHIVLLFFAL